MKIIAALLLHFTKHYYPIVTVSQYNDICNSKIYTEHPSSCKEIHKKPVFMFRVKGAKLFSFVTCSVIPEIM